MKLLTQAQLSELSGRSTWLIKTNRDKILAAGHGAMAGSKPRYFESAVEFVKNLPDGRTLRLWVKEKGEL